MEPPTKRRRIELQSIIEEETLWQWICRKIGCLKRFSK